jgi:Uncharacterised nucleotidyltransferase
MVSAPDPRAALLRWLRTGQIPEPSVELTAAAVDWGLAGLLDTATATIWAPGSVRDTLHAAHLRTARSNTLRLQAAADAVEALATRGLRALPLKGAALAERVYASVGHRPMTDVDILALDDWGASVAALVQAGLAVRDRADHAWSFEDGAGRGGVELHYGLTSCPRLHPVDAEGLWARSRVQPAAQLTRVPSPEDLLVQVGLHAAFQHGLAVSPIQYMDIRRLLEHGLDPDLCADLAAEAGAERALWCALAVAEAVTGATVPERLRSRLAPAVPPRLHRWVEAQATDLPGLPGTPPRSLGRLRWALSSGRRLALLRDTLRPTLPGGSPPPMLDLVRRGVSLARTLIE